MPHIFISYARHETKDIAIHLEEAFNAIAGVTAWMDRSIPAGMPWEIEIQRQILRCDFMVVLYSPDINRKLMDDTLPESYVLNEITYAQTAKKRIIPVMAQLTTPPFSLIRNHYIDFVGMGLTLDGLRDVLCFEMGIVKSETKSNVVTPKPPVIETAPTPKIETPPKIITPTKPKIVLPAPFDWCYIPEGQVTFEPEDGSDDDFYAKKRMTVNAPAFWMAKYPITNKQYREFVTETGNKPYYWDDNKWNGDDYPVVGMTWYDAIKFCLWLSKRMGEKITLPSDVMWQRAAQADDGRKFPWWNTWDASLCNNNVDNKGFGKTTPVRQYEAKYRHPYGLVDMAGNVYEWCLTIYKTGENRTIGNNDDRRVMMSCAWNKEVAGRFVCTFRGRFDPLGRHSDRGFRLARI